MIKTKYEYYCDLCGKQLENSKNLYPLTSGGGHLYHSNHKIENACWECTDWLRDLISKRMNN